MSGGEGKFVPIHRVENANKIEIIAKRWLIEAAHRVCSIPLS